ncbi:MAG TPA: HlyC/CorC family transporter [Fermentimonas caenicola]|jgi:putative hemolysin|uniref:HlyC/CorC family transporter n=1 Tax=Fermentimonas caenicola TaxID=1562970 RepID=A0A098BYV2_9BACT|nr:MULTISPECIES: hemolysin family protein [Lascolabacillus]MBP6175090.1 HlyC/CorC family transporter [Fermentimonas sp.]MDI9625210.1 hemolysin family protein [Bacteroidota bacterium]TAH60548.1 MAG: HlyC/CorC family transporter [Fermentimonas caenicola]MBP6196039.1 HlyC/CorC family transporter [Fermentimonas sp.]MBP7103520.1 HlyC/CorC family transporter [Fermentimonas sp.]
MWIDIIIILLLILLNGFFALSEIAIVSARKNKLESAYKNGSNGASRALKLQSDPDNFLSSVQVGITLIGIINGAYGGQAFAGKLVPFFDQFAFTAPFAEGISMVTVVFLITYISIVIGELVPKTIALNYSEKMAVAVAPTIYAVSIIFYPFVKLLSFSTGFINRLIGLKPKEDVISEMELRAMLKTASHEGIIDVQENIIHEQVFYFSDKRARHLMTHRTDVEWVDISKSKEEVIEQLLQTKHSKILACRKKIDDFVGIISMRDFLMRLNSKEDFTIEELIMEPIIVPNTVRAQKVLENFKNSYKFVAVVVDEYGSLDGIITIHDIFENLVGNVPEETDVESTEPLIFIREDNSALVSGEAPIEILTQFDEDFIVDFDKIDYSTVAGFVFTCINKIPGVGDKFEYNNLIFEIMDVDGNKIDKVLITRKMDVKGVVI